MTDKQFKYLVKLIVIIIETIGGRIEQSYTAESTHGGSVLSLCSGSLRGW